MSSKTPQEWGSIGGRTTASRLTAEQRKQSSRRAYLAGAVAAVVGRSHELTPEQTAKLLDVLVGAT